MDKLMNTGKQQNQLCEEEAREFTVWYCVEFKKHWAEIFLCSVSSPSPSLPGDPAALSSARCLLCSLVFVKYIKLHFQQSCWLSHWDLPRFSEAAFFDTKTLYSFRLSRSQAYCLTTCCFSSQVANPLAANWYTASQESVTRQSSIQFTLRQ